MTLFSLSSSPLQVSSLWLRPFVPFGIRPFPCLVVLVSLDILSFAILLRSYALWAGVTNNVFSCVC